MRGRLGASPRVRGRRDEPVGGPLLRRSIPAGAGPTTPTKPPSASATEHPRGCGADPDKLAYEALAEGASPRVRGRHQLTPVLEGAERSIPAGAGPTGDLPEGGHQFPEHPRGCGADMGGMSYSPRTAGASPRVRGRRCLASHRRPLPRSIPAGAGPTSPASPSPQRQREHPRGCGADLAHARAVRQTVGSIPAGAGPTAGRGRALALRREHPRGCGADTC